MNNKLIHKVNGGLAFYFGIGSIIGAIIGLVAIVIDLYLVFTGQSEFVWWVFVFFVFMVIIMGLISYVLLRVGYEEFEK